MQLVPTPLFVSNRVRKSKFGRFSLRVPFRRQQIEANRESSACNLIEAAEQIGEPSEKRITTKLDRKLFPSLTLDVLRAENDALL